MRGDSPYQLVRAEAQVNNDIISVNIGSDFQLLLDVISYVLLASSKLISSLFLFFLYL